ncbi:MAG: SPASM domain-containing protein [Deltaproteobacteria bacterium]|nr:SPASM domain-containing protein [Deltaproteobacteria bacterium]
MPHVRWEGSTNFRAEGCPAGSEKIYVTPYGDVFPCAIIQTGFGNLLDEPIEEIWKRMGAVASFDGRVKPCLVACDEEFINKHFEFIRRAPGQPHEPWAGACTGDTGPHEANPS